MSSLLSLRNASKLFTESGGRIELFRDLDFDLGAGEFVAITQRMLVSESTPTTSVQRSRTGSVVTKYTSPGRRMSPNSFWIQ